MRGGVFLEFGVGTWNSTMIFTGRSLSQAELRLRRVIKLDAKYINSLGIRKSNKRIKEDPMGAALAAHYSERYAFNL